MIRKLKTPAKVYFLEEMGFQLTLKGIDVGSLSQRNWQFIPNP